MNDLLSSLTERQRQLLGLVVSGVVTSKELAKLTGLSPGYIDQTLSAAGKTLGVRDRIAAAEAYNSLQVQERRTAVRTTDLPNQRDFEPSEPTSSNPVGLRKVVNLLWGPPLGGAQHSLRWYQVTLQILRVGAIGLVTLLLLVLIILAFFRTFS